MFIECLKLKGMGHSGRCSNNAHTLCLSNVPYKVGRQFQFVQCLTVYNVIPSYTAIYLQLSYVGGRKCSHLVTK